MHEAVKPRLRTAASREGAAAKSDAEAREFGGTFGAAFIMTVSHLLMLYLWIAWRFYDGALFYPSGLADIGPFLSLGNDLCGMYAHQSAAVARSCYE